MGEQMVQESERPFAELPAALVDEVLQRTGELSQGLLNNFEQMRTQQVEWHRQLKEANLLSREAELPHMPIPTTCGVDGSYAVERLLATDLVVAAAVGMEGLTPPSETRYWPEPHHRVLVETEVHEEETSTLLRAMMIGMELELAAEAPHDLVFLDGSLTTPLIYFNQALNKISEVQSLKLSRHLLNRILGFLRAYHSVLSSIRTDKAWIAIPKYTTRREIERRMEKVGWPNSLDDRALLSYILEPGEFTKPQTLEAPRQPWHLNINSLSSEDREEAQYLRGKITSLIEQIQVVYYRPYSWLPALRLELTRMAAENPALLSMVLHGIKYQCGAPAVMEPYPLYMADRMVKHLPRAIPVFRQVATQRLAEHYRGNIGEVYLGLHGYRTEGGV